MKYILNITEEGKYIFSPIIDEVDPPISDIYVFDKKNIIEGVVSDEIALNNRNVLNESIIYAKENGFTVFEINNIDAYFKVSENNKHEVETSIEIPSDFHFKMGDNCDLRVQPNNNKKYVLVYSRGTENVLISGGVLWGDRYDHEYSSGGTQEWGHLIMFRGVHNSTIDNVELREGTGDGFEVGGIEHRNNDGSIKANGRESYNVTIKNCIIDDNRRNNISIVDGTNIFVEYNTISNSGSYKDDATDGTSPRAGIDIEPYKKNAPDNNSVYDWEKCEEIHIRHNKFINSGSGDLIFFNGENSYAYGNEFSGSVGTSYGYNNKIYDNIFTSKKPDAATGGKAINIDPVVYWANGEHRLTDWEIYGNTITGYQFGMVIGGKDNYVHDNTITNCQRGITFLSSASGLFENNDITSNVSGSIGYRNFWGGDYTMTNMLISGGTIDCVASSINLNGINVATPSPFIIDNVTMLNVLALNNVHQFTVQNCTYPSVDIRRCTPTLTNNNNK